MEQCAHALPRPSFRTKKQTISLGTTLWGQDARAYSTRLVRAQEKGVAQFEAQTPIFVQLTGTSQKLQGPTTNRAENTDQSHMVHSTYTDQMEANIHAKSSMQ